MKICPLCNSEYDSRIEYCFRDGTKLDSSASSSSSSSKKLATQHLDSMGKHSMDSMETLDNISIHDLLQIGGGGFQGFGEFTPIDAPVAEEGNTMISSRSELQAQLEKSSLADESSEQSGDPEDIEDILDSLGGDIGAHLDDTLDGIQVGQVLDDSSLDMGDSNEILPGDTLDVLVDELDVPQMTESDLNRFHEDDIPDLDGLDAWEASGPIMQEAARNALAQHRMRLDDGSSVETPDVVTVEPPEKTEKFPVALLFGGLLLLIGGGIWAMSGDSGTSGKSETAVVDAAIPEIPEIPAVPKVPVVSEKETKEPADENSGEEPSNPSETLEEVNVDNTKPTVDPQEAQPVKEPPKSPVTKQSSSQSTKANTVSNTTASKPAKKPEAAKPKKKKPPPKPKTKPKPIPQKDPQEDNGWGAVQSGGWGAATCAVKVNSNVTGAKVYIDGQQKGSVGKSFPVDCGDHKMEVRLEGYKTIKKDIYLENKASFTIEMSR